MKPEVVPFSVRSVIYLDTCIRLIYYKHITLIHMEENDV